MQIKDYLPFLLVAEGHAAHAEKADLMPGSPARSSCFPGRRLAIIAGLPPGTVSVLAIVPAIIAALLGFSYHLISVRRPPSPSSFSPREPLTEPGGHALNPDGVDPHVLAGLSSSAWAWPASEPW